MKAIILAAGLGTRLLPLTAILPKCLMPINGVPLLAYWLKRLSDAGVSPVLINLHYYRNFVLEWIEQSSFKGHIQTSVEEMLLGTAGTVLNNKAFINDEPLMLIHGDNLSMADIRKFMAAHASRPGNAALTMMTFETCYPENCGIIKKDVHGIVREFYEKVESPPGNLANGAIYILEPEVVDFLTTLNSPFIDFSTEVLPVYTGRIYTWHNGGYHRDIGCPDSLLDAQIEYPGLTLDSVKNSFWGRVCDETISFQMVEALADYFSARIVNGDGQTKESIVDSLVSSEKKNILSFHNFPSNTDEILDAVKTECANSSPLIFFFRVPQGFSSRKQFDTYHLKSLAMRIG
ncbi:MAG: nucleotidyltransferase family protein [Desulfamplus sp.]|nr:nucleotidyltransferase family protein [Desulfamplus sp.]